MSCYDTNIYKIARLKAGKTQEIEVLDLPRASIRLINRVIQFAEKRRDRELLTIAEDGVISPEERPLYEEIVAELDGLIQAAMELKVAESRELQE